MKQLSTLRNNHMYTVILESIQCVLELNLFNNIHVSKAATKISEAKYRSKHYLAHEVQNLLNLSFPFVVQLHNPRIMTWDICHHTDATRAYAL